MRAKFYPFTRSRLHTAANCCTQLTPRVSNSNVLHVREVKMSGLGGGTGFSSISKTENGLPKITRFPTAGVLR
ncbi:hypothetical protein HN858_03680 [Candidatus Falkowbacteria bacterium]|nr:hypothetical protein [Candidatus Falkowbacteria bacterium]